MFTVDPYHQREIRTAHDLIEEIKMGTLVTRAPSLDASPLPFLLYRSQGTLGTLIGHMASANRQSRTLTEDADVLVTFTGPQAYVSASWYQTGPRVPTWYYTTVHVHGRARLIEDADGLRKILQDTVAAFDAPGTGWRPDPDYVTRLLPGIIGIEIEITRLEAQQRLGQESPDIDHNAVRRMLLNGDLLQQQVAQKMIPRE